MNELAPLIGSLPPGFGVLLSIALLGWVWRIDRRLTVLIAELRAGGCMGARLGCPPALGDLGDD